MKPLIILLLILILSGVGADSINIGLYNSREITMSSFDNFNVYYGEDEASLAVNNFTNFPAGSSLNIDLYDINSLSVSLGVQINFIFGGIHSLKILNMTDNYVLVEFRSQPQDVSFVVGESKIINLGENLNVTLKNIINKRAYFSLAKTNASIKPSKAEDQTTINSNNMVKNNLSLSVVCSFLALALVVFVVFGIFYIRRRKRH